MAAGLSPGGGSTARRIRVHRLCSGLATALAALLTPFARAEPAPADHPSALLAQRTVPAQPDAPTQHYQPDQQACTPERLLAGYRLGLAPYADQPPAVLDRLSVLQRQLSARSLKVCLEKELLTPDQVERLMATMGMSVPAPEPAASPAPAVPQPVPGESAPQRSATTAPADDRPAASQGIPAPSRWRYPSAPSSAAPKPAGLKPAKLRPTVVKASTPSTSRPTPSSFDMSPIEWSPTGPAPSGPRPQDDPGSPPR